MLILKLGQESLDEPNIEISSGGSNSANHNQNQENKDNQIQIAKKPRKYKRRSELLTFTTKKPKKEQLIVKKKMIKSKAKVLSKKQLKLKMKERKEKMKNRKKKMVSNCSDEENEVDLILVHLIINLELPYPFKSFYDDSCNSCDTLLVLKFFFFFNRLILEPAAY